MNRTEVTDLLSKAKAATYDLDSRVSKTKGLNLKTIPGFESYVISDCGTKIYRRSVNKSGIWLKEIKPQLTDSGYYRATLTSNGKKGRRSSVSFARLVLFAHKGLPGDMAMEADHIDFNPKNNHISNLQWVTRLKNNQRRGEVGRQLQGSQIHLSKLSEKQVEAIMCLLVDGVSISHLAAAMGITEETVRSISRKETWKHVNKKFLRKIGEA